jgi:hypothetical protein
MIKHDDLKCEFCDGYGEFSRDNSDGVAVEGECQYCKGTGIDEDQLRIAFLEHFSTQEPCALFGCSLDAHNSETLHCPSLLAGSFYGWLETKFLIR